MERHPPLIDETALPEKVAQEKIELSLQRIDRNIFELVDKVRKPQKRARALAKSWHRWRTVAMVASAALLSAAVLQKFSHKQ